MLTAFLSSGVRACCNDMSTVQETLYAHRVPVIGGQSNVVHAAMIMICIEQGMLTPFPSSGVRAWWFMLQ